MNFGQAIEMVKAGKKMTRPGWNGKGMYVYLTHWSPVGPVLLLRTAQGSMTVWTIDLTSALAEDWVEYRF